MMKKILISAYSCDPYGVSESYAAFNWVKILCSHFEIYLITNEKNLNNIKNYYKAVPQNLRLYGIKADYPFQNKKIIHETLKLGYFIFNYKLKKFLIKNISLIESSEILFHKSPSGIRYISCLSYFATRYKKNYVFGPTGGGLKPPKVLRRYFKKESLIFKLRNLDTILLNSRIFRNHYQSARWILISLGYVKEILGNSYEDKFYEILDTGIDTEYWNTVPIKNDSLNLLYVGKLTRYKGAELLLRAIAKIPPVILANTTLNICGEGEEKKFLNQLVEELKLTQHIVFHGYKTKQELRQFYKNSSIFVFPTITEGSGNSLLEAMSSSLPIITLNNGGPKYMCPDSGSIKIELANEAIIIDEISKSIVYLYENENERIRMGASNRKHCVNTYDWKLLEGRIVSFFENEI